MTRSRTSTPHSMLWFARDLPNLCSLAGLACAVTGIYFAVIGVFPAAMVGLIWAVVFDWMDGRVARKMGERTEQQRQFGAHLDSLIDVVSFVVAPALLLLSASRFSLWCLPGAVVYMAAGVVRLGYFNTFGLIDSSTYRGLALDNNMLLLVAVFAFQPLLSAFGFTALIYVTLLVLAALNVAPIKTPKLTGGWYYAIVAYAAAASVFYAWRIFAQT